MGLKGILLNCEGGNLWVTKGSTLWTYFFIKGHIVGHFYLGGTFCHSVGMCGDVLQKQRAEDLCAEINSAEVSCGKKKYLWRSVSDEEGKGKLMTSIRKTSPVNY